jgi:amino acid transporter
MLTAHAEAIGFRGHIGELADSTAPLQLLANLRGLPMLGPIVSVATVLSFFACTLACINAAARTFYRMSRDGFLHSVCGNAHENNQTPHVAVVLSAVLTFVAAALLILAHVGSFDIYGWLGTIATYGFITVYGLVVVGATLTALRGNEFGVLSFVSLAGATIVISLAVWSSFDPTITGLYRWLPYLYAGMMVIAIPMTLVLKPKTAVK